jgi:hypothetical protein
MMKGTILIWSLEGLDDIAKLPSISCTPLSTRTDSWPALPSSCSQWFGLRICRYGKLFALNSDLFVPSIGFCKLDCHQRKSKNSNGVSRACIKFDRVFSIMEPILQPFRRTSSPPSLRCSASSTSKLSVTRLKGSSCCALKIGELVLLSHAGLCCSLACFHRRSSHYYYYHYYY